jgi:four helix bundle protein
LKENDLKERLFRFAIDILKLLATLKGGKETNVIKYQLSKSSTSSGANYEESQAATSRADFVFKVSIALKEMRESNYWLRIISELFPKTININSLVLESEELGKILATIILKAKS